MRRGFEHAGNAERGAELLGVPIETPEVQAALMLYAYRQAHHQSGIDTAHWEQNDEATQSAAVNEWVKDPNSKDTLAAAFRAYARTHPHKRINIEDDEELGELLAAVAH